jgi:transcriptional regulator with XRE-family HTH domain
LFFGVAVKNLIMMEFDKKIQELRKQKGLTQEELAQSLYVSRTAISKWESGRGYPNIDSLKAMARFFGVTVDELLSGEELLTVAEADSKERRSHLCDLVCGLLDVGFAMLLFLPFFADRADGSIQGVSLLLLQGVQPYVKIACFCAVIGMMLLGIVTLALQSCQARAWQKSKAVLSLSLGALTLLLLIVCAQPYAAVFAFGLLTVKVILHLKRQ